MITVMMMMIMGLFGDGLGLMKTARISLTLTHSKYENGKKKHSSAHGSWFLVHGSSEYFLLSSQVIWFIFTVQHFSCSSFETELHWMRAYDEHHFGRSSKSTTRPIFTFVRQSTICSIAYHSATNHALMWKRTQKYWLIAEAKNLIECQKQKQNIHAYIHL